MGSNIDNKISEWKFHYSHYLSNVRINKSFFLTPATPKEVYNIILSLDLNKSVGPNSLPIFILKICNEFFSHYLSKIINTAFTTGIFPNLCKLAKVIPIFKKDDPLICNNYRPISLLPVFNKIFEKIIYTRMYEFLESNKLIYKQQFGFRSNHSTSHALISITESIKSYLDKHNFAAGIFVDLEKAFDTVNHEILCHKLNYYGIRGVTYELIRSFLTNRNVSVNGFDSSQLDLKCGVPQGSTLGPLLFLIYINALNYALKFSSASHFADDTSIIYTSKNLKTLETNINFDLKSVSEWLKSNRLSLNVGKTKLLLFRSKCNKIQSENISIKIQGVKLSPCKYVKYLTKISLGITT